MKTATFLTLMAVAMACMAQTPDAGTRERVRRLFSSWSGPETPGAAVAVVQEGRIVLAEGFGGASLEHRAPITASTLFDVASLAKQFTAFAVLLLREEGRLDLDDPVRKHLPEFPDFGVPLTVRHLLHHQGGLRDWGGLVQMSGGRMEDPVSTAYVMSLILNQKELAFRPGTEYSYCNAGYVVLAEIVRRVSGSPFPEWMKEKVFGPLGMETARFGSQVGQVMAGAASSYRQGRDGAFVRVPESAALPGPGSLHLSIADLARWQLNMQTRALGGESLWLDLLEPSRLADGTVRDYAAGLIRGEYRGLPIWSHSGTWAGFQGETLYFPGPRLAVAVLINHVFADPTQLARAIADICLEGTFPAPAAPTVRPLPAKERLDGYAGLYWLAGDQTLAIAASASGLTLEMGSGSPLELECRNDRLFVFSPARFRIEFPAEGPDRPEWLTFWRGDYAYRAERIAGRPPLPADPSAYTGIYYSPELKSTQQISREGDRLVLCSLRRGNLPLAPIDRDAFGGVGTTIKIAFGRSARGDVSELFFSMPDARNVRFLKLSPPPPG